MKTWQVVQEVTERLDCIPWARTKKWVMEHIVAMQTRCCVLETAGDRLKPCGDAFPGVRIASD